MINFKKISQIFNEASIRAGRKIMEYYDLSEYQVKIDGSPITKADREANKIITKIMRYEFKDIKIVSEENNELNDCDKYFLIDPLDGTKEFLSKNDQFTVNIALIVDEEPILGSIYLPAKDELLWNDEKNSYHKVNNLTKKIYSQPYKKNLLVAEVSRSHIDNITNDFIKILKPLRINRIGSSMKICNIACGKSHIYPRFTSVHNWDIAAGHSILKKAGGDIFNLDGKKILYKKKENLVQSFIAFSENILPRELSRSAQELIKKRNIN